MISENSVMIANPSLPSVPDGLHVDELTLAADGLLITARFPSTRRITRWLTGDPATLSGDNRRFVEALGALSPKLSAAAEHVRAFREILCQGEPADLEP